MPKKETLEKWENEKMEEENKKGKCKKTRQRKKATTF
jgi:hypothetical protein